MGWTLTGCNFERDGRATRVMANGNNAAWVCDGRDCAAPVLFVYRGVGGRRENPVTCTCGRQYLLAPEYRQTPEPEARDIQQPDQIMQIRLA